MIWLYRFLFLPLMLLASPYYVRRMLRRGGYGPGFAQRFGATPSLPARREGVGRIWIQAVSVGEMLAIGPLLDALLAQGDVELYLTTTTSTGYKLACERYASKVAAIGYFPIDSWFFSRRAWAVVKPDLVILTEGERWPEHIRQAAVRGVPVVCVNARMSDRGFARMKRFRRAVLSLFGGVSRWLPCSIQDAERLAGLGFPADRITPTGNIKLDVTIPALPEAERARLRVELGLPEHGLILLGSSTWPGEEIALLEAFQAMRSQGLDLSLLLVPRHAERRAEVRALLEASSLRFHFRSAGLAAGPVDVAVGDTTGELRKLTQLADLVFVGKTLPPHHEGQTPIEAAALGKPIVYGPKLSNFREIACDLTACGAAVPVPDAENLAQVSYQLLCDPARRQLMAQAALKWHHTNQGAIARTVAAVREEMREKKREARSE